MTFPIYSSYQESGVDWLGSIPAHWKISRLRFLCGITTGNRDTQDAQESGEYPFFVRSDHIEKIDSYSFDGEGVFTSGDGAGVGKIFHYYNGKCEVHQRVYLFYNFQHVCGKFFYEYLKTMLEPVVLSQSAKSTVDSLRLPMLQNFWMTCPPKNEQLKILNFLDHEVGKIDTLIAEQQKLIALLKEKRQAVISHAVTKGLNPDAPMKDSGVEWLGQVPEHWGVPKISHVFFLQSGDSITAAEIEEVGSYEVFGGNGLRGFTEKFNCDGTYNLIGRQGALCGNVHMVSGQFFASEHAIVVYPLKDLDVVFYRYFLEFMNLGQYSTAAAQPGISVEVISQLRIAFPPASEQKVISNFIHCKLSEIGNLKSECIELIDLLKERRSALISAAVTGKIDVRGWQPPAAQ